MSNMKLYQGDCLQLMKNINDKSVDMILCDLPYGTTRNKWDAVIDAKDLWRECERIIKDNGAIVLFSQMPFTAELVCSNRRMFRYEWVWEKATATGHLNCKKMPMKKHENILVFYKQLPTYNPQFTKGDPYTAKYSTHSSNYGKQKDGIVTVNDGFRYPIDILKYKNDKGLHPTQKSVDLLMYLIKTYTNKGELVLDNCMGSGSAGVACLHTKRDFIGIELEEKYFTIASERIDREKDNLGTEVNGVYYTVEQMLAYSD
ncbi:MAG: DNA-methyltransferase [Lachnospiraceae bacterium]